VICLDIGDADTDTFLTAFGLGVVGRVARDLRRLPGTHGGGHGAHVVMRASITQVIDLL